MFQVPNNKVACEAPKSMALETQGKNFVTVKQRTSLMALKVVYPPTIGQYKVGDTVYIKGNDLAVWAREKFSFGVEGSSGYQEFILVPLDAIQVAYISQTTEFRR